MKIGKSLKKRFFITSFPKVKRIEAKINANIFVTIDRLPWILCSLIVSDCKWEKQKTFWFYFKHGSSCHLHVKSQQKKYIITYRMKNFFTFFLLFFFAQTHVPNWIMIFSSFSRFVAFFSLILELLWVSQGNVKKPHTVLCVSWTKGIF